MEAAPPSSVELMFRPNAKLVPVVRRFVYEFYARVLSDADLTSRLALATHELVENAVKYGQSEESRLRLAIVFEGNDQFVVIQTWNKSDERTSAALKQHFHEMKESAPETHYQNRMKIAAKAIDGSGLGLARIRAEADMTLKLAVEGDQVCITARAAAGKRSGA